MDTYWTTTIHKDGNHVELRRRRGKQKFFALVEAVYLAVDERLNHALCQPPDKLWDIPMPGTHWDTEYDIWDRSVGSVIHDFQDKIFFALMDRAEGELVLKLPIDQATTDVLWPEMSFLANDDEED